MRQERDIFEEDYITIFGFTVSGNGGQLEDMEVDDMTEKESFRLVKESLEKLRRLTDSNGISD